MTFTTQPEIGTGVVVRSNSDLRSFWLGRRKGSHGAGKLSLPGGTLEPGETPLDGAKREIMEEMGFVVPGWSWNQLPYWSYDPFPEVGRHFVTLYFECKTIETPALMEPHRCEGWELRRWSWDLDGIDKDELFAGVATLGYRGLL